MNVAFDKIFSLIYPEDLGSKLFKINENLVLVSGSLRREIE